MYISGTRADYGLMVDTLKAIDSDPLMKLSVLVTGMHLSVDFGETIKEVEKDGFKISHRVAMLPDEDTSTAMGSAVGSAIVKMSEAFDSTRPEIVLLEGDRGESLAAAIAAAHMNIAVAHISGGDVTGTTIDESIRHAISKFAHIHFPGTRLSAQRLQRMGEAPWRVHMVGTPGCSLKTELNMDNTAVAKELGIEPDRQTFVVLQHPVTTEAKDAPQQMRETMEALVASNEQSVVIYPNADSGGREMIKVIKEYDHLPSIHSFISLPRQTYVGLLNMATVLVGNSSSGIVEAPDLALPAINIGSRQRGRERGGNLIDVGHDREEIGQAIKYILNHLDDQTVREKWGQSPYRDVDTAQRIAKALRNVELAPELIQKRFYDDDIRPDSSEHN